MSVHTRYLSFRRGMAARRLVVSLCIAISVTLILTAVSLTIYKVGGFYRYDLSRPGYEKERKEISTTPSGATYDSTSPLTQQSVETFLQQLDIRRTNLEQYNTYPDDGLSDDDLQLTETADTRQ